MYIMHNIEITQQKQVDGGLLVQVEEIIVNMNNMIVIEELVKELK